MTSTNFRTIRLLLFGALLMGGQGCVEEYDPNLNLEGEILVVDASITDQAERQFVRLVRSLAKPFNEFVEEPMTGAKVTVLVNGAAISLRETTLGSYELPEGYRGRIGDQYQLRFTTPGGQRYESTVETMQTVPPLNKVYDQFNPQGIADAQREYFIPTHDLYIDTQDPADARNFYRWTWTLWERQDWCHSCQGTVLIGENACGSNAPFSYPNAVPPHWYDYNCRFKCWDLFFSRDINVFADRFSNGQPIIGRRAGQIPYYQAQGALVEIRQQALTAEAYRYYQLFQAQTQANGGLADTPPVPLIGNVRNLANEREIVVGYFTVGAVSTSRYWLDRKNATGTPLGLFQAQNGNRAPIPEPFVRTPFGFRPPTALCIPSDTRTATQPEGWRQ
ncbi:MAG: DUF4249 domain-containing protein [Cytophagaceae bacterium]|nr:DUF4249 domain-containing protein [Cytophagaceae bacterium]